MKKKKDGKPGKTANKSKLADALVEVEKEDKQAREDKAFHMILSSALHMVRSSKSPLAKLDGLDRSVYLYLATSVMCEKPDRVSELMYAKICIEFIAGVFDIDPDDVEECLANLAEVEVINVLEIEEKDPGTTFVSLDIWLDAIKWISRNTQLFSMGG